LSEKGLSLLDKNGNVIEKEKAISIIDNRTGAIVIQDSDDYNITPSNCNDKTELKLKKYLTSIRRINETSLVNLDSIYSPKIWGISSKYLSKLNTSFYDSDFNERNYDFQDIAVTIIAFIDQWCVKNTTDSISYNWDIISTKRSWFNETKITGDITNASNGLSWNLYGQGMSVSVYSETESDISDTTNETVITKTNISFTDESKSASVFLKDAIAWFSEHKTPSGKNIKIYGAYPSTEESSKLSSIQLANEYKNDDCIVYWGGLFSSYSNYSQWEYHPGFLPNEVDKMREYYLNHAFVDKKETYGIDLFDLINSYEAQEYGDFKDKTNPFEFTGMVPYEIIEEDFLTLYSLKSYLNSQKKYKVYELLSWANNNPYSLKQALLKSKITATDSEIALYETLSSLGTITDEEMIKYDDDTTATINPVYSSYFKISTNESTGIKYIEITYEDLTYYYSFETDYIVPLDKLVDEEDFEVIRFGDTTTPYTPSIDNILKNENFINDDIKNTMNNYHDPKHVPNEFGPLEDLKINPAKPLITDPQRLIEIIKKEKIFDEMITPPGSPYESATYKGKSLDLSSYISKKYIVETDKFDEMISPDKYN
jgi:hypothetical protein